jgi:preprotein translocase subunit SecG
MVAILVVIFFTICIAIEQIRRKRGTNRRSD